MSRLPNLTLPDDISKWEDVIGSPSPCVDDSDPVQAEWLELYEAVYEMDDSYDLAKCQRLLALPRPRWMVESALVTRLFWGESLPDGVIWSAENTLEMEFDCERCDECDDAYRASSCALNRIRWIDRNGSNRHGYLCDPCRNHIGICDGCSNNFHESLLNSNGWCEHCREDEEVDGIDDEGLYDYSYKPDPCYHGTPADKLYMWIELEVELPRGGSRLPCVEALADPLLYAKCDSSLNHGFEIVTHPMGFDWIDRHRSRLEKILATCKAHDARSHDVDTCGLHIHLSRNAFTAVEAYRFMQLVEGNPAFFETISRRKGNFKYCEIGASPKRELIALAKGLQDCKGYRRSGVNVTRRTLEVRFWRGTLGPSFLGSIEFTHAMVLFCRTECGAWPKATDLIAFIKSLPSPTYDGAKTLLRNAGF